MQLQSATTVDAYSVGDLVTLRMDPTRDTWRLSLVQRGQVWKDTQVAYLLDSLLFGYPIGSLLLCTVHRDGGVLEPRGGVRVRVDAAEGTWQLLDGQQRLNSLAWLFAGPTEPEKRRFLVQLDAQRGIDDVTLRTRTQQDALRYIKATEQAEALPDRWRWFDVSRLYAAWRLGKVLAVDEVEQASTDLLLDCAERIDPACSHDTWRAAGSAPETAAATRVRRLLRSWYAPAVPVVRISFSQLTRSGICSPPASASAAAR